MKGIRVLLLTVMLGACRIQTEAPPIEPTPSAAPLMTVTQPAEPPTLAGPTLSPEPPPAISTPTRPPSEIESALSPEAPEASLTPVTWETFTSETYGISLKHPSSWTPITTLPYGVSFVRQGTGIALRIRMKHADEDINLVRTGVAAGDIVERDPIVFLGRPVTSQALVYQGRNKAVFYDKADEIVRDDLIFVISLEKNQMDYEAIDIPPDVQTEADAILRTVELAQDGS